MTRLELQKLLDQYHPDTQVCVDFHSDYEHAATLTIVPLVDKGFYLMSAHATMNKSLEVKQYILIGA